MIEENVSEEQGLSKAIDPLDIIPEYLSDGRQNLRQGHILATRASIMHQESLTRNDVEYHFHNIGAGVEFENADEVRQQAEQCYRQAIDCYTTVTSYDRTHSVAYYYIGVAHTQLYNYELAIHNFDQAIKFDKEFAQAYNYRGVAKSLLELYSSALKDFDMALMYSDRDDGMIECNRDIVQDAKDGKPTVLDTPWLSPFT